MQRHSNPILRKIGQCLACALIALLPSCGHRENDSSANKPRTGKLQVYVVNYPLKYFAQRIGGELVDVHFPALADGDPAFWKPTPADIHAYQNADAILLNGADYAKWVAQVSLPLAKMVNTTAAVKDHYIEVKDEVTHQHGPDGDHSHSGFAFTTWLDFTIAAEQSKAVHKALEKLLPDQEERLSSNFVTLHAELLALDEQMRTMVADHHDQPLLASHPVYQYLEKRYDLTVKSVHWEPGEFPSESQWEQFDTMLTDYKARWMIWEDAPKKKTADALKQRGIEIVVFRPCGNEPMAGDFLSVMHVNLENLRKAFSK